MKLKNIGYGLLISTWLVLWWWVLLSKKVSTERDEMKVKVEDILYAKDILDQMFEWWSCVWDKKTNKTTDWEVDLLLYSCDRDINWEINPSDYVIAISKFSKTFPMSWYETIENKDSKRCLDTDISFWKLNDKSPIFKSKQSIIIDWEEIIDKINDTNCKKLLNLVQT